MLRIVTRVLLLPLLLAAASIPAAAQEAAAAASPRKALDHADYAQWKRIGGSTLSRDGRWLLYTLAPPEGDGDGELIVRSVRGETEHRVPRGGSARFSADGRFVVAIVKPPEEELKEAKKEEKKPDELPKSALVVLTLENGAQERIERVQSFRMPVEGGAWFSYEPHEPPKKPKDKSEEKEAAAEAEPEPGAEAKPAPGPEAKPEPAAEPKPEPGVAAKPQAEAKLEAKPEEAKDEKKKKKKPEKKPGKEIVLRHLADGREWRFPEVSSHRFSEQGDLLVYAASSKEAERDGVFAVDPASGAVQRVLSDKGVYKSLVLDEAGRRLAFLSDRDDHDADQPSFTLWFWERGMAAAESLAAEGRDGLPAGWWVSEHRGPSFSKSGERILFRTAPKPDPEPEEETPDDEKVVVDVWHWQDPYLQPMQLRRASQEKNRNYLAVVLLDEERRVVQLADPELPDVSIGGEGDGEIALGSSDLAYRRMYSWDTQLFRDVYRVDVRSGAREPLLTRTRAQPALSPQSRYARWWDAEQRAWLVMELESGEVRNLSAEMPHPVHNELHDSPSLPRSYGAAGWLEDDRSFLVYDRYDVWALDPSGSWSPRCVTEGAGRRAGLRLRVVDLDPDEPAIDPEESLLLTAFHLTRKEAGFYRDRVRGGGEPERLVLEPKRFGRVRKAEEADVLLYTRESFTEFPDLWSAGLDFKERRKLSDANPQQAEYRWGSAELVSWHSAHGTPLQGLLYKPDGFDPARKYPMLTYFYERRSDNLHQYHTPAPGSSSINFSFYVSRGYLLFVPDIPYEVGYPGDSAMAAVIPGVLSLVDAGFVDREKLGVQGHSWGGYQISYMITQTDLFACAEAGAPVSNMTSAYGGIRWGTGMSRMFQYEKTQSRIGGTLWDSQQKFIENSPLFWADRVKTPLLMLHNDKDGAVPWYQGIEFFVALRRLDKPVWMLNYNGEDHGLRKRPNRKDWAVRMQQFFDHYLMDAPAPLWLAKGVPAVDKGRTLGLDLIEE